MCVRVRVCLSVCVAVAERGAYTNWRISFKSDIQGSRVHISSRFVSFPPIPKIKSSSLRKKFKILIFFQKWLQRFWLNFVGLGL